MKHALGVVVVVAAIARPALAGSPVTVDVRGRSLVLVPPDLPGLEPVPQTDAELRAWWAGKVGASDVEILLHVYPPESHRFSEPEQATAFMRDFYADPKEGGDPAFEYESEEVVKGPFGWVPYAALASGPRPSPAKPESDAWVLGGILDDSTYVIQVKATPRLPADARAKVVAFLKGGVTSPGKTRDANWTDAEIAERWNRDVPSAKTRSEAQKPVRTKHYVIMTNSSAGSLFAKKMEECYSKIQKVYPFPEVEGRRLMPVFVFRTSEEYVDYYVNVAHTTREDAAASKGHAWRDYYATYYDAANDPVHVHEATHQIFMNRLFLDGGGSWFQEGVAEYVTGTHNDRNTFARPAARQKRYTPLKQFVVIRQLLSSEGAGAGNNYLQAASIIEFLRDSKWHPDRFQKFVHAMGRLSDESLPAIEGVIRTVYGTDLDDLEKAWAQYWAQA
jgi:hypothetical protein